MKRFIFPFLAIIVLSFFAFGADVFNQSVTITETYASVQVEFQFTWVDSSNAYHTQPIFIADCNDQDAFVAVKSDSAGDANVIYHYTMADDIRDDTAIWFTTTAADLDSISNSVVLDTIGIEAGSNDIYFHSARWLVVEVVGGGTTNKDNGVFNYWLQMTKDENWNYNAQPVTVGRVAPYSYTAP